MHKLNIKLLEDQLRLATHEIDAAKTNTEINTIVENLVISLMDSELSSVWFYDEENAQFLRERGADSVKEISLKKKQGVLYKCFMTKTEGIYNYLTSEKDYELSIDNPDNIKMKSKIMLPLIDHGKFIGIVTAYSSVKKINIFTEDDLELLKTISPYIINAIYKMHPHAKTEDKIENDRRSQLSKRAAIETVNNAKALQEFRDSNSESSDETLAFMSNTIHDIRTPANTLFGFLDLLEDQISDPRLKQYLLNAKESAGFINDLTNSILDRISSQRERSDSKKEKIDSIKFFSGVAQMFSSNMYAKKLNYNVFIDPLMPKVILTEQLKFKRIIMNLINNAYKFTPTNKSISFSVIYNKKGNSLSVSVKDTGIGIAKEKQKEIFKAFKQADDTTVLNYGGTGLGLAISSDYVKDLGGEFRLESEPDEGSEFSFDIPLEDIGATTSFQTIDNQDIKIAVIMDASNKLSVNNIAKYLTRMGIDKKQIVGVASASDCKSDITHLISFQNKTDTSNIEELIAKNIKCLVVEESLFSISKENFHPKCEIISQYTCYVNELYHFLRVEEAPKVLIVDDDKISISLIKTLLEGEFCSISIAEDGEQALNLLINAQKAGNPFSLAYFDNQMPKITGLDVIKRFRKYESENQLNPIYAVSISGEAPKDQEDRKLYDMYATKPFEKEDIRSALYQLS